MAETITIRTGSATDVIKVIAEGPQGANGQGVPVGGTTGQVLRKASGSNYDTEWATGGGDVDLSSPDPIGDVTPNTGAFTTLSATGTATLPHIHGSLAGNLYIHVKNTSGGQLTRGTPVYIVGNVGSTDRVEVAAADFDDVTKMPAVGLLEQTLANNGSGDAIILGELDEANTNAYTINTELFVGNNGALTSTRPTAGQVQSVGVVARVNSNTGVIVVNMQGQRIPHETFAAASHTHGNLTNAGAIGTTANLPVKTGTSGVLQTGAFGTAAGQFAEGNHTHAAADITDLTSAAAGALYDDVLSVNALSASDATLTLNNTAAPLYLTYDGITAARTIALPNASGTIALTSDTTKNLWIPASAWIPKTTSGCGVDSRETTTNDQNFDELLFDPAADEFADALVVMPSNYNNSTVTARFYWTAASSSGTVEWAIQGRALANDDSLDTAAGTKQSVNDTLIAADDMHVTSATSACTIGGTPSSGTPIQFTIYRDVSEDTLAVDARLLGVEIIFN